VLRPGRKLAFGERRGHDLRFTVFGAGMANAGTGPRPISKMLPVPSSCRPRLLPDRQSAGRDGRALSCVCCALAWSPASRASLTWAQLPPAPSARGSPVAPCGCCQAPDACPPVPVFRGVLARHGRPVLDGLRSVCRLLMSKTRQHSYGAVSAAIKVSPSCAGWLAKAWHATDSKRSHVHQQPRRL